MPALHLPLRTPTRWLLTMRNPVNLCVSNAEMGHKADAVFDVCDRQIGTLATAVIVRHLWHSEVLPREATTTWWYEDDAVAHTVVGNVSKGECQMINRVLLHSTSMKGNLDAVPHACTTAEEGDAPVPYRPSYMFGLLARRATKNAHAVQWPEGTIQQRDLGVPRCCGAFTPSTRLVSISR